MSYTFGQVRPITVKETVINDSCSTSQNHRHSHVSLYDVVGELFLYEMRVNCGLEHRQIQFSLRLVVTKLLPEGSPP